MIRPIAEVKTVGPSRVRLMAGCFRRFGPLTGTDEGTSKSAFSGTSVVCGLRTSDEVTETDMVGRDLECLLDAV